MVEMDTNDLADLYEALAASEGLFGYEARAFTRSARSARWQKPGGRAMSVRATLRCDCSGRLAARVMAGAGYA